MVKLTKKRQEGMRDDDDAALVLAARAGDRDACAALIGRRRPLLFALCRRMLGDAALVEDAAQEALLQALLNLDRLQRPEQFGPWLGGIGLNVCRRLLHARATDAWSLDALYGGRHSEEPVDWEMGPAELAEQAEVGQRVRHAVDGLPRGQRAAVVLFYLSGLSHAETAAQLGIDIGAVKTRLHKARGALRRRLSDDYRTAKGEGEDMSATTTTTTAETGPIEVIVDSVRRNLANDTRCVVLKEIHGSRYLVIWIGHDVSHALAAMLHGSELPRPLTHTLMGQMLDALDGRPREVRVTRLDGDVYYAALTVEGPSRTVTLDARPSDAITMALIGGVPILVEAAVLDAAGVTPDRVLHDEAMEDVPPPAPVAPIQPGMPLL